MPGQPSRNRPPLWFIVVIALTLAPVLLWPLLMSQLSSDADGLIQVLVMGAPLFALLTAYLAYISWSERPYISYLLVAMAWLTYGALGMLYNMLQAA